MFKIIVITIFFLSLNSCNNDENNNLTQNLEGNYTGTFTVEYLNGDTFSNPVTISFNGENNYQSSSNDDYYSAGGNGTYEKGNSTINFNDVNQWTANFDWNLILSGEYNYSINRNELLISAKKNDVRFYKYALIKDE